MLLGGGFFVVLIGLLSKPVNSISSIIIYNSLETLLSKILYIMSEKTVFDVERAKFKVFWTYKLPTKKRVDEIMEATKKEYPNFDNYLLWLCAVDYVLEEKGLKKYNDDGVKMYEEYVKQKNIFIYNTVTIEDETPIEDEYIYL